MLNFPQNQWLTLARYFDSIQYDYIRPYPTFKDNYFHFIADTTQSTQRPMKLANCYTA